MHETLSVPFEVKFASADEPGTFSGYGSVFSVMDDGGDLIVPGAFKTSLEQMKAAGRQPAMYMQHGAMLGADPRPVGKWLSVEEDEKGLLVKGKIVGLDTETGRYNYALMKEGAMTGLSIGYRATKVDYGKKAGDPRRTLKEVKLGEISVVDQPMNAFSRVTGIKSGGSTEREIETWLTQDAGFSRREARIAITHGFKALIGMQDAAGELAEIAEALKRRAVF